MMEVKDEGNESGKLGKPRKPKGGARGSRGTTRVSPGPQAKKGRGIGQRKQEREGKLVGKEGKGWGWRVVRFGISSGVEGARHLRSESEEKGWKG